MAARKIPRRRMQRVLWDLAECGGTECGSASAASGLAVPWMRRCRPDGIVRLAQIRRLCCRHRQARRRQSLCAVDLFSSYTAISHQNLLVLTRWKQTSHQNRRHLHVMPSEACMLELQLPPLRLCRLSANKYHELDYYRPRRSSPNTIGNYCIKVSV
jgi:hypothetical protein